MKTHFTGLVLSALVLATVAYGSPARTSDAYLAELNEKQATLESEFNTLVEKFYSEPQDRAKTELRNIDQRQAYVFREISNLFTMVEYRTYAIRHKAHQAAREILQKEFNHKIENTDFTLNAGLSSVLLDRIELRALLDGMRSSELLWNELFLRIPAKGQASEPLNSLVEGIFLHRKKFDFLLHDVTGSLAGNLEKYCNTNGYKSSKVSKKILIALDRLIDQAMGCPECSKLFRPNKAIYNIYPMFADYKQQVDGLGAGLTAEPDLMKSIESSRSEIRGHLKDLTDKEIQAVDEEDIDDLQVDYTEDYDDDDD